MTAIASHGRPGKTQTIPFTGAPATSQAIGSQTYRVRLVATAAVTFNLGDETGMYLAPNFPEVFLTTPGQTVTNIVQVSAAGNLYLTELE
jgi:hypothetical protein